MAQGQLVQIIVVLLVLASSRARDLDGDGIDDAKDSCPFDNENDRDNDGICANTHCVDDPSFRVNFIGATCTHFEPGGPGHGKCAKYQRSNMGAVCASCSCACKHDAACGFDPCPSDPENDADKDGICGDVDTCPLDKSNDLDSDGICEHEDSCPIDPENDKDGDKICGNLDACPQDRENDADNDLLCGDEDSCPFDPLNDIDSDNICGDLDTCPMDKNNDEDGDNMCAATECFDDPSFASRKGYACSSYVTEPTRCALESVFLTRVRKIMDVCSSCGCACASQVKCGYDPCPLDKDNDADGDNLCANEDVCPHDPQNDADSDNICGDVDSCPLDAGNDVDGDKLCDASECFDDEHFTSKTGYTCSEYRSVKGFCRQESTAELDVCTACGCACASELACGNNKIDPCPNDEHNDQDDDGLCGDVDSCPLDKENDIDGDELCADVDPCPKDPLADTDSDNLCSQQDNCPNDPENDIDGDLLCAGIFFYPKFEPFAEICRKYAIFLQPISIQIACL